MERKREEAVIRECPRDEGRACRMVDSPVLPAGVPSEGGEPKDGDTPMAAPGPNPEAQDAKKPELSAEDRELSERLDLSVERLRDTSSDVQRLALELLRSEVRGATRCAHTLCAVCVAAAPSNGSSLCPLL